MTEPDPNLTLDFSNTEIAFSQKSDKELKKTGWLFKICHLLSQLLEIRFSLYFVEVKRFSIVKKPLINCMILIFLPFWTTVLKAKVMKMILTWS